MTFNLAVPKIDGNSLQIDISVGQSLFILGANGTGKSSLLQRFYAAAGASARRISASRQNWFQSNGPDFAPSQKQALEQQDQNWGRHSNSRYIEQNSQFRSGLTLYGLIDAENENGREVSKLVRLDRYEEANVIAKSDAPILKINELLCLSNIPIEISLQDGDRLMASKSGGPIYSAAELSDGERNALLIAADVLTARAGTLLIIDEPERHLHRSIIAPLLTQLFQYRPDCAFVVGTHDLMMPTDNPDSQVLLVRSCTYDGSQATHWDVDLIPADAEIDEGIRQDIVGARRKIIFVEGKESSLDRPLYNLIFPNVSVRPKGSSRDVEQAVRGISASGSIHWVRAWGIIDSDGRDSVFVDELKSESIFALPFYSVESIYYHPIIIESVSLRHAGLTGVDGAANARNAIHAAVSEAGNHISRFAERAVEKSIRRYIGSQMPTLGEIRPRNPLVVSVDIQSAVEAEENSLKAAVQANDWLHILTRCPIRESQAQDMIARAIGFQTKRQYESAVLQMLRTDDAVMAEVRNMFGDLLIETVGATPTP